MDAVIMILLENKTGIPLDVVIYINGFMHYEKLSETRISKKQSNCGLGIKVNVN
jgi:hypothetical protein